MARPRLISDEQMLQQTREAVLAHGPRVSLDVVAGKLGVTQPALLKRFGTRQALLLKALMPPQDASFLALLEQGPDDRRLEVQLRQIFVAMLEFYESSVPCMLALRESGIGHDQIFSDLRKAPPFRALELWGKWFERAEASGLVDASAPEGAALAITGALHSRVMMNHLFKREDTPRSQHRFIDELVHLFTRALSPHSTAPTTTQPTTRQR